MTEDITNNIPAAEQLRSFIERIESLLEDKRDIQEQVKEVYAEAKATGFDTKVMRQVIKLRALDAAERQEMEAVLEMYMDALSKAT